MGFTTIQIEPRWGDMDAQGHLNNVSFVEYLQEGRTRFLMSGPLSYLLDSGVVVVSHQVTFHNEGTYRAHPLEYQVAITNVGGSLFDLGQYLVQDGEILVKAATRLCPFDFDTRLPKRLRADERVWFERHHGSFEPMGDLERVASNSKSFRYQVPVRWSDLDKYGHVNNVRTVEYLQEARIQMGAQIPAMGRSGSGDAAAEYLWVLARQDVKYLKQLEYRSGRLQVAITPCRIGKTSINLSSEIIKSDGVDAMVEASTVLVCVDRRTGRPTELPDDIRQALAG